MGTEKLANAIGKANREMETAPPAVLAAPIGIPPPPPPRTKGKILCLHGGASSGPILRLQMGRFRAELGDDYEFIFPNGSTKPELDPFSPRRSGRSASTLKGFQCSSG